MTFIELLNQYSYIAWIVAGLFLLIIIYFTAKLLIVKMIKRIKKQQKRKVEKQIVYVDKYLDHDLTTIKNLNQQKFYYEAKGRDFFAKKSGSFFLNLLDIRGKLNRRKKRKHPEKVVLIRMEMNNGQFKEFCVVEDEKDGFKYKGKKYIFDLDARYYVIDSNIWAYDFHESLTLPVKRTIPVNRIKSLMEHSDITEVENAINPVTLERFIKSEIAQGILQGASIGKLFKVMLIILFIIVFLSAIDFIVGLWDSGIIQQLMDKANK